MPVYDSLSYGEDKYVIVVEIGTAYTKCGLAGESGPRCIIPSEVKSSRTGRLQKLWNYCSTDELYENLKDFFYLLFFRHLLVGPKDKRLVVLESILCPSDFRETLARLLFTHYEVGSALFTPCQLMSLLTLGTNTGLVIDIGFRDSIVIPVYDGIPVLKALQSIPVAGKAIHNQIKAQLLETANVTTEKNEKNPLPLSQFLTHMRSKKILTPSLIEAVTVQCCFVTKFSRGRDIQAVTLHGADVNKLPSAPPGVDIPVGGSQMMHISGKIREHSCEVLFQLDNDEQSIATLVLDALMQCPVDTRRELSCSLVVLGGTTMIPGFLPRLQEELKELLKLPKYSGSLAIKSFAFHQPPALPNYTGWLGGAMVAALETLPGRSLSRDAYLQLSRLPDWCVLGQEEKEEIKTPVK